MREAHHWDYLFLDALMFNILLIIFIDRALYARMRSTSEFAHACLLHGDRMRSAYLELLRTCKNVGLIETEGKDDRPLPCQAVITILKCESILRSDSKTGRQPKNRV